MAETEVCKPTRNGSELANMEACESDPCMNDKKGAKSPRRWQTAERMLMDKTGMPKRALYVAGAVLLVLLLLLVVVITLSATWPRVPHHLLFPVCKEPSCLRAAAQVQESLNASFSPCKNLWSWACGGWLSKHTLPPGKSIWNQRHQLMREEAVQIRELISTLPLPVHTGTVEWKLKHLYEACVDVNNVNADHDRPLKTIIGELGGWYILRDWNIEDFDARFLMKELQVKYGVAPFIEVSVRPNPQIPGRSSISISPSGLGLPAKSYYYGPQDDKIQQAYKQLIRDAVIYLTATKTEAEKFGNDIFHYEKRIAEITPDPVSLQNPVNTNNFIRLSELKETVRTLPLHDILVAMYPESNVTEETEILVTSPEYLNDISQIVSTTDSATMNSYMMWTLVRKYMPYLSSQFTTNMHSFESELYGNENPFPRWEKCVNLVKDVMGTAVEALLEKNHPVTRDSGELVVEVFENVKRTAERRLEKLRNQPDLHRHLKTKLTNLKLQIGLPDKMKDESYLKSVYRLLIVMKANLFESYRNGVRFLKKQEERLLVEGSKDDYTASYALKSPPSAGYSPASNAIVVPRALLSKPVFESKYPRSIIYGRLGVDIANAIVASIFPFQSAWKADSKLLSPFHMIVNESLWIVQRQEGCLKKTLASKNSDFGRPETVSVLSLAKQLTALGIAHEAFVNTLKEEHHTHQPSLEMYEDSALFFLSFSQSQCTIITDQYALYENVVNFKVPPQSLLELSFAQVNDFKKSLSCEESRTKCDDIL